MTHYGNYLQMIYVNQNLRAEMLEESPDLIKQIYDAIRQCTPDYDVEKVYQMLFEQAVLPA